MERCIPSCPMHALTFDGKELIVNRATCDGCTLCVEACPTGALSSAGHEVCVEELISEIEKDVLLFDNSGGGVTFSGGEPLFQPAFLRESLMECRRKGIHTALETSGYALPKVFESIIDFVDLFLFDVKLLDDKEHRKYTGVSNRVIKTNLKTLIAMKRSKDVVLRFPVITGVSDTEENIKDFMNFALSLAGIDQVDLLPYHDVSEKYKRLGLDYKMRIHIAPSEDKLKYIRERLEKTGLKVKIRG
jgi:pyruvate formate lyase activating enzyme